MRNLLLSWPFYLVLIYLLITSSCNLDGGVSSEQTLNNTGNQKDIALLIEQAYEVIDKKEIAYPYNMEKANLLEKQLATTPSTNRMIDTWFGYCQQLLYAGKTERCIVELEKLSLFIEQKKPGNPDACVIPVLTSNLYTQKPATRQAIKIYEDILRKHPKDKESIWLLNLAYMVLGEYPNKVAEQWRIPPEKFQSTSPLEKFHNIAAKAGVDDLGLAGGCAFDDFNNDGFMDIITATTDPNQFVKYFQNKGNGTFEDLSQVSNLGTIIGGLNMTHADYNNDGYLDVLILRGAWDEANGEIPNSLLKNNGDGTFTDVMLQHLV